MMRDYYVQRASAGLILTEATSVSPMGWVIRTRRASGRRNRRQVGNKSPLPSTLPAAKCFCNSGTSDAFPTLRILTAHYRSRPALIAPKGHESRASA